MSWPTPQDYNEAVQNPQYNFGDPELRAGELYVNPMGLPGVASGAFASVYRMRCGQQDFAVRCFLQPVVDQQQRYQAISQFVLNDDLDCTVAFEYLTRGIRVQSAWHPLLKMEWVSGQPLDGYVRSHLKDSAALIALANNLQRMLREMHANGIAHGDLQHGNIIVTEAAKIRLVDYDGMYVPSLAGHNCPELGHRNYQHPGRTATHFGPYLDNFAAWSIYVSLVCLSRDPLLLDELQGGDECLLFRIFDYKNPTRSRAFAALERHTDPEIRHLSQLLRTLILTPVENVPKLGDRVPIAEFLPELSSNLPDWLISNEHDTDDIDFRTNINHSKLEVVAATHEDPWPTISQYASAMASPAANFTYEPFQTCRALRVDGHIRPVATNKHALFRLYKVKSQFGLYGVSFAVKVFLENDEPLMQRYEEFSRFLNALTNREIYKFLPGFHHLPDGIKIGNRTYPILRMDWIEGSTLEELLTSSLPDAVQLANAKVQFRSLCSAMSSVHIIHGELEASNLILSSDATLRIIDFDCVHIQSFGSAERSQSTGALRHPSEPNHVDEFSDRLPSWLLDTALTLLEIAPDLHDSVSLLVSQPWSLDPLTGAPILAINSFTRALESRANQILQQRIQLLNCLLNIDRSEIPLLRPQAAISGDFAAEHNLDFGRLPDGWSNIFADTCRYVSPDLLPQPTTITPASAHMVPVPNLALQHEPSQDPLNLTPVARTGAIIATVGMAGSIVLQNYLFLPFVLLGIVLCIAGLMTRR